MSCLCWYVTGGLLAALIGYLYVVSEKVAVTSISGKRAIVTGGSSGIGLATAIRLVKGDCSVVIIARDQNKLDQAVKELIRVRSNSSVKVFAISADIQNKESIRSAVEKGIADLGGLDILVANAGVTHPGMFLELPDSAFQHLMNVNYFGTLWTVRAAANHFVKQRSGRILIVSSMAGLTGVAGFTAYCASKFALRGFAETLHMELQVHNVQVSLVCPPDVDTPCYAEENKIKPLECKLISEGSSLVQADVVAADIVSAIKEWRFFVMTGMDGHLLSKLVSGVSPLHNPFYGLIEVFSMGLLRVVMVGYRWSWNRICHQVHAKKISDKSK